MTNEAINIKNAIHHMVDLLETNKEKLSQKKTFNNYAMLVNYIYQNNTLSQKDLEAYFSDDDVIKYIDKSRVLSCKFEREIENFANLFITGKKTEDSESIQIFKEICESHVSIYEKMVMNEIKIASIDNNSHVCHVGIGKMPLSLLILHKKTNGCKITGIDIDNEALVGANECIEKEKNRHEEHFGREKIKLRYADGCVFDYSYFDVIILSTALIRKQRVVEKVVETAKKQALLIDRKTWGLANYLYKSEEVGANGSIQKMNTLRSNIIASDLYKIKK